MEGIEDLETLPFEHGELEGYDDFNLEADLAREILPDRPIGAAYDMVVTEFRRRGREAPQRNQR